MIRDKSNKASRITCRAKLLRAAMDFTSSEASYRYPIGVLLEPHPSGKGVLLIATDGFRMVVLYDANGTADGWLIVGRHKMPADATRKANIWVELDGHSATYSNGESYALKFRDCDFPDWRLSMPESCVAAPVTVDLSLLSDLKVIPSAYFRNSRSVHVLADSRFATPGEARFVCTFGKNVPAIAILSGVYASKPLGQGNSLPDFLQPVPTHSATVLAFPNKVARHPG